MAGDDGALEGTYRFLGSAKVKPNAILAAHVARTAERARHVGAAIVAHDTTEFNFGPFREQLGRVGRGKSKGFYAHVALAVTADGQKMPLGVVAMETTFRERATNRSQSQDERQQDPKNESLRWGRVQKQAEKALEGVDAIHVMDREADHYLLLAAMKERGAKFVVRMSEDRVLAKGGETHTAKEALELVEPVGTREVKLSARRRSPLPSYRRNYPERRARTATLEFSATTVTLRRPHSSRQSKHKTIELNLVHVREVDVPKGKQPVEWRLWTILPIDTPEQIEAVVDAYRVRWVIEEYFKAIKTGCAFEDRQLRSRRSLLNALPIFLAVAWRLLALRTAARSDQPRPALDFLTELQLFCLRGVLLNEQGYVVPKNANAREALLGVARLAGHLKRNGDPGWQLIGRGFEQILSIERLHGLYPELQKKPGKK